MILVIYIGSQTIDFCIRNFKSINMTGIVLSGGGARGFAHVGVLKALHEMGIKPGIISGTSSGAVMGAYYSAGFNFDDIIEKVKNTELFSFKAFSLFKQGLFNTISVRKYFEKHLLNFSFEQLNVPLVVAATDFQTGKSCYFSKGSLIPALLASSAIPVLYQPVVIDEMTLVDGGLSNNFPLEPISSSCDIIIGVHVNPLHNVDVNHLGISSVIDRSLHLAIANSANRKRQQCSVFIEPPQLVNYGMFDMDHAEEIAAIGYNYTMQLRMEIEKCFASIK